MTAHHTEHQNDRLGSFATPCNQCGLPIVYQSDIPRWGWEGFNCHPIPYTPADLFRINMLWNKTYQVGSKDFRITCPDCFKLWKANEYSNPCGNHFIREDGTIW